MKVSVSLPDDDVKFLDQYAKQEGYASRSAVLHRAVRLLRASRLGISFGVSQTDITGNNGQGID